MKNGKIDSLDDIKKIIKSIRTELQSTYQVKEIAVFGSYARNENKKSSDLDILVDFYKVPDLFKFIQLEDYLMKKLGIRVDLVRKPVIRKELRNAILREAVEI